MGLRSLYLLGWLAELTMDIGQLVWIISALTGLLLSFWIVKAVIVSLQVPRVTGLNKIFIKYVIISVIDQFQNSVLLQQNQSDVFSGRWQWQYRNN